MLRFVGGGYSGFQRFDQALERRAVRMFGGISNLEVFCNIHQICLDLFYHVAVIMRLKLSQSQGCMMLSLLIGSQYGLPPPPLDSRLRGNDIWGGVGFPPEFIPSSIRGAGEVPAHFRACCLIIIQA